MSFMTANLRSLPHQIRLSSDQSFGCPYPLSTLSSDLHVNASLAKRFKTLSEFALVRQARQAQRLRQLSRAP